MSDGLHFGAPELLWLAPLVALALIAFARRTQGGAPPRRPAHVALRRVSNDALRPVPELGGRLARGAGRRRPWLLLGALLCLAALARPQWGVIPERRFEQAREVLIALDLSRSMLAADLSPSRLERAKLLILGLLPELRGERVGLVVFAGTAFLQSPLSVDSEALRDLLPELTPDFLPQGGTDYAAMLRAALEAYSTEGESDRFLVVLSDGEAHDERWREALDALAQRRIRVLALGLGTAEGALLELPGGGVMKDERGAAVLSRLEPATLEALASATGGVYRDAALWVDLGELVESSVARGREGRFAETREPRRVERFQWLLLPGLACWFLAGWLELPARPRVRSLRPAQQGALGRAALLLLALAGASPHFAARGARAAEGALPAPPEPPKLAELVAQLSLEPAPSARDFAQLAETTLSALAPGGDAAAAGADPARRRALVRDGLEAVDAGEALDPGAAAWKELRERLRAQSEPTRPPPAQPQPGPPQEQESRPSEPDSGAADTGSGEQGGDGARGESEERGGDAESQPDAEPSPPEGSQPGEPSPAPEDSHPEERGDSQPSDALGPLEAPEPTPRDGESAAPQATQVVGGSEPSPELAQHPELAGALEKQRRVREADSPARLFDALRRAEGEPQPQPGGKPW